MKRKSQSPIALSVRLLLAGLVAALAGGACLPGDTEDYHTVVANIVYSDPAAMPAGEARLVVTDEVGDATPIAEQVIAFGAGAPPGQLVVPDLDPATLPPNVDVELILTDTRGEVTGTAVSNDVVINSGVTTITLFVDIPRQGGQRLFVSGQLNGNPLIEVSSFLPAQIDCRNMGLLRMDVLVDDPESDPIQWSVRGQFQSAGLGAMTSDGPHALLGPVASNTPQTLAVDFGQLLDADVEVTISAVQVPPGIAPIDGASFDELRVTIACAGQAQATPQFDDSGGGRRLSLQEAVTAPATPHILSVVSTDDGAGFSVTCDTSLKGPDGVGTVNTELLALNLSSFGSIELNANNIDYLVHYLDPARPNSERINATAPVRCFAQCVSDGVCAAPEVCDICADCGSCDADGDGSNDLLVDWSFEEGRDNGAAYDHAIDGSHDGMGVGGVITGVPGYRGLGWELPTSAGGRAIVFGQSTSLLLADGLTMGLLFFQPSATSPGGPLFYASNVGNLNLGIPNLSATFSASSGDCSDTVDRSGLVYGVYNWVVGTWDGATGDAEVWLNGVSDGPTRCTPGTLSAISIFAVGTDDPGGLGIPGFGLTIDELKLVSEALTFSEQCALWGISGFGCP